MIKPWLSKETVGKVDILGSNYKEVLLDLIDEENLPASLGGGCTCEGGCEYSFAGPWKETLEERRERRKREAAELTEKASAKVNGAMTPMVMAQGSPMIPTTSISVAA